MLALDEILEDPCSAPDAFLCPITHQLMQDPYFTVDGHCYEKVAIENWLRDNDTSPQTGSVLESKRIIPAITMKKAVEEWKTESHKSRSNFECLVRYIGRERAERLIKSMYKMAALSAELSTEFKKMLELLLECAWAVTPDCIKEFIRQCWADVRKLLRWAGPKRIRH